MTRRGERRERTARRVSLMRYLSGPPSHEPVPGTMLTVRRFWEGDIARMFGVPLYMLVSWPSRQKTRVSRDAATKMGRALA